MLGTRLPFEPLPRATLTTERQMFGPFQLARPGLGEVSGDITTEGATAPNESTDHALPRRTETGMLWQLDLRWVLTQAFIGIPISLHLHRAPHPSTSTATELRISMPFEASNVECWAFRPTRGNHTQSKASGGTAVEGTISRRIRFVPLPFPDPARTPPTRGRVMLNS